MILEEEEGTYLQTAKLFQQTLERKRLRGLAELCPIICDLKLGKVLHSDIEFGKIELWSCNIDRYARGA
jgi:hypothetical protein